MADVTVLSDNKSNAFVQFFDGYGFTCQQAVPALFGTPYLPPSKLLIIPSAFGVARYYKILPALEGCRDRIEEFVREGGIVLAYGAGVDGYRYRWLPMAPTYRHIFKDVSQFKKSEVKPVGSGSSAHMAFGYGLCNCDGYYTDFDGDVELALEDGRPVLIYKKVGKGLVVASGIFDYPDVKFVEWACRG